MPDAVVTKRTTIPLDHEFAWRICLVPVAAALCHLFGWDFLRSLTADLTLQSTSMFGVYGQELAPDLITYNKHLYRIVTTCTGVDAWCAAIPLVWKFNSSILKNSTYLVGLAAFVFVGNLVRLTLTMFLVTGGLSWFISHDIPAAVAYLILWLVIKRRAAWVELQGKTALVR